MSTRYDDQYPSDTDGRMAKGSRGAPLLAGLMIGSLIGASAMLLLAPQEGRRTRREVQKGALELKDRTTGNVRDAVSQARTRAQDLADQARAKADDLQNQGKDIAIEQLDRVAKAAQSGKKSIQASKNQS